MKRTLLKRIAVGPKVMLGTWGRLEGNIGYIYVFAWALSEPAGVLADAHAAGLQPGCGVAARAG